VLAQPARRVLRAQQVRLVPPVAALLAQPVAVVVVAAASVSRP
jgi:hypothetical protein